MTKRSVGTAIGDKCDCVCATGFKEREEAEPGCLRCSGTGVVDVDEEAEDIRSGLKALDALNAGIDELAGEANDCATMCPQAKTLLDLAWYFTEAALREARGTCSAGCDGTHPRKWCCCCAHLAELAPKANGIKSRL